MRRRPVIELKIVYDNEIHPSCEGLGLHRAWGFSVLLKSHEETVLFDCGWRGRLLRENLNILGEDPASIDRIIISHDHWDHMGGLPDLLEVAHRAEVYVGAGLSNTWKSEIRHMAALREIEGPQAFNEWLLTPGELKGTVKEVSLVVKAPSGTWLITGCAHPGLVVIKTKAEEHYGKIQGLMGGFHGFSNVRELGHLTSIVPCHCTQHMGLFFDTFGPAARKGGASFTLKL